MAKTKKIAQPANTKTYLVSLYSLEDMIGEFALRRYVVVEAKNPEEAVVVANKDNDEIGEYGGQEITVIELRPELVSTLIVKLAFEPKHQ